MMTHYDLIVVGAGPAGSECARRAAELGLATLVLERLAFPRAKVCAGGLTMPALRLLGPEIGPLIHDRASTVEIRLGDRVRFVWRSPRPVVATVTRAEMDSAMAERAAAAGARVELSAPVRSVEETSRGVSVEAGGRRWTGEYVVGADGARSLVRSALGLPAPRMSGALYVRAFPPEPRELEPFGGRVLLDLSRGRRGYVWIFPKRNHLNIGIYSQRPLRGWYREELLDYVKRLGVDRWDVGRAVASAVPRTAPPSALGSGRTLLAGDAAGLANPVTGEGIAHAVASGRVAAEAVREGGGPAAVRAIYRRRVASEVLPGALAGSRFGKAFYLLGPRISERILAWPPAVAAVSRVGRWDRVAPERGVLTIERGGPEGLSMS